MSIARDLSAFITQVSYADIPPQALDHAAMLISSTVASAACGIGIMSSKIMRDLANERGGTPDASIWFDSGGKLPVVSAAQVNAVMSDAAASDDSDLGISFMPELRLSLPHSPSLRERELADKTYWLPLSLATRRPGASAKLLLPPSKLEDFTGVSSLYSVARSPLRGC